MSPRTSRSMLMLTFAWSCAWLSGCIHVLPSASQSTDSHWKTYEEARQAFSRIESGQTSAEELWRMGFNPYQQPNIRLLNYLDIMRIFMPNESIRLADLHPDIQNCLRARNECSGYEIVLGSTQRDRYGNALTDIFNFRRNTRITGWQFRGLIVLQNQRVIYKLDSGQPNTLEYENKKNPLGPLQDLSLPAPR